MIDEGMQTSDYPQNGARFQLDRLAVADGGARYQAALYLPAARHDYELSIALPDGACALRETGRQPPEAPDPAPWAVSHLQTLGRQLFRAAQKDGAWQRRLSRWRGDP